VTGEKWDRIVIGVNDPAAIVGAVSTAIARNLRQ
jgi:hypothetical protein